MRPGRHRLGRRGSARDGRPRPRGNPSSLHGPLDTVLSESRRRSPPSRDQSEEGGFRRDEASPAACDLLVVNEAFVADVLLVKALLRTFLSHGALLLVGDIDHIPR
ncbi:AAA family ATPase [Methylorubrum thiocyanatum]